jgi:hypothetical protein
MMDLSKNQAPGAPSGIAGWALNIVPSLAAGLVVYFALAQFVGASGRPSLSAHFRRSAALYILAAGLGAILVHDAGSADFWSMGQLVLWLWLAAIGGIVADGLTVLYRHSATRLR